MEEKVVKKSNVGLTIIVAVLSFVIGVVGCFAFYKCFYKEDVKTNVNNQETNKCEPCKEDNQKKFYDEKNIFNSNYEFLNNKIESLVGMELLNRDITSVKDLTNQEILQMFVYEIARFFETDEGTFTLDDVNTVVKYYFGTTIEGEDIYCAIQKDIVIYKYDAETKVFKADDNPDHGHGGSCYSEPIVLNRIIDVKVNGSKVVLKVNKAFSYARDTGFSSTYFRSMSDLINDKNVLFEALAAYSDEINYMHLPNVTFNTIDSKDLLVYEYVFEYDEKNDNYIFVSYKLGS